MCVGNATDRSVTRASVCRLLLIRDGVQNGFRGPWTTWNPPAPSNPAHYDYTVEIQIDKDQYIILDNECSVLVQKIIRFTLGALWPMGAWGPRRDLIAKRTICLLTKMNSSTNTFKTNATCLSQMRLVRNLSYHIKTVCLAYQAPVSHDQNNIYSR